MQRFLSPIKGNVNIITTGYIEEGEGMFCINCGYNLGQGGGYCPRCGAEVEYEHNQGLIYSDHSQPFYKPRHLDRTPRNNDGEMVVEKQRPSLAFNIVSIFMLLSAAVGMSLLTISLIMALEDKKDLEAISKFIEEEETKKIIDLDLDSDGTYIQAEK